MHNINLLKYCIENRNIRKLEKMNEWNLSLEQTIILFIILYLIVSKIWFFEPKTKKNEIYTKGEKEIINEKLNPDYGAYVWLAGKRFN